MKRTIGWMMILALATLGTTWAQDWDAQTSGTTNPLFGVWFLDPQRGFAVGAAGTILETEDGGETWTPILLTIDDMLDVAFSGTTGLMVGDNGRIFRTVNAGQDWVELPAVTGNNLTGVAFGAAGRAYVAGRDGTILRSLDSGATWALVETGAARYRSVTAFGERAWAVGNEGVMRATNDGGASWFSPASVTVEDLHDVSFVSDSEGWVAGQSNILLHTVDGGATWNLRNASIGVDLNTVFFGNPALGWTGGFLGNAYHSVNGALTWDNEPTPTTAELNAMHFPDAFHGWAVVEDGGILTRQVPATNLSVAPGLIEWDAFPGDPTYDVVRGDLGTLLATGGDFSLATQECVAVGVSATSVAFLPQPSVGQGSWFLVRVNAAGDTGTYDSGSFRQSGLRDAEIGLSVFGCP